jgi:short-subunit dehydrogenase
MKIALITGATKGLGRALTLTLLSNNYHVYAIGRTVKALDKLANDAGSHHMHLTLVPLDLMNHEAIYGLTKALKERNQGIDLFIHSAAHFPPLTPITHLTPSEMTACLSVNTLAPWHLLKACDTLFQDNAHVLCVTDPQPANAYWGAYAASKRALEALWQAYAAETQHRSLHVQTLTPPPMDTDLRAEAFPGEDPKSINTPQDMATTIVSDIMNSRV